MSTEEIRQILTLFATCITAYFSIGIYNLLHEFIKMKKEE